MNLKNLSMSTISGDCDKVILTAASTWEEYGEDRKRTGKVLGTKYTVVCPGSGFDSVVVKIAAPPIIQQAEINARNAALDFVYCHFVDFKGTTYTDSRTRELKISGTATSIIIDEPDLDFGDVK